MQESSHRSPQTFHKSMSAISLQSLQTLGSVAAPHTIRRNCGILPDVPENGELSLVGNSYHREHHQRKCAISGEKDEWDSLQKIIVGLFQRPQPVLEVGELASLHETLRKLQNTNAGPFIYEYYKQQILTKGMMSLREHIRQSKEKSLLYRLEEVWENLFAHVLPLLDAILFLIKTREGISIRQITLAAFRDLVVLDLGIEDILSSEATEMPPGVKHMLLILYNVNDTFPPNKNKLRLESLLARAVVPFLGFKGLYCGQPVPLIESSEPQLIERRRSSDSGRRISRPFSIQPRQMDTLNEMFLNALRKLHE
ncbi:proline-rich protein 5-like [Limulus polyphemus]|uniref:Proline-rich protein 5-like n=1 Tax=Limulus polyphemus TaxID=6850 RepID=A0ABM1B1D1_LIMPO|nr:proline-rich protein 5-like [Limulus polyphemus]XP_022239663.1 proline-rich protein 5-like [Limulus polyphemus]